MTKEQIRQYRLALEVLNGKLEIKEFALMISKSYRQAQRIIKKVKAKDVLGVVHGNKGKVPINKTPDELESLLVSLIRGKYSGFNQTHLREYLLKNEGLEVKKDVVSRLVKKHGLSKFAYKRKMKVHRPRPRMEREGMLVQFDGSEHLWFGNEITDLLLSIDDATGKILAAEFFRGETSFNAMKVLWEVIENFGIPYSFYFDQAGIYGKKDREWTSQIARALEQINCQLLIAGSPQAKGRVERVFRTLQDRLITELRYKKITKLADANEYLKKQFIPLFNKQFGVRAMVEEKAFQKNIFGDLDLVFCRKEKRKIASGNVFSYQGHDWLVMGKMNYQNRILNVNTHLDGSLSFDMMGLLVKVKKIERNYRYLKSG